MDTMTEYFWTERYVNVHKATNIIKLHKVIEILYVNYTKRYTKRFRSDVAMGSYLKPMSFSDLIMKYKNDNSFNIEKTSCICIKIK